MLAKITYIDWHDLVPEHVGLDGELGAKGVYAPVPASEVASYPSGNDFSVE